MMDGSNIRVAGMAGGIAVYPAWERIQEEADILNSVRNGVRNTD